MPLVTTTLRRSNATVPATGGLDGVRSVTEDRTPGAGHRQGNPPGGLSGI